MKKLLLISLALVFAFTMFVPQAMAKSDKAKAAHVYLYEKTPVDPCVPWPVVEDGAWGKLTYTPSGPMFYFVFNGHNLPEAQSYTLIYYPDIAGDPPFPREVYILGSGTTNNGGNVNIAGSYDPGGSLPFDNDVDEPCPAVVDAKIWLVPTDLLNAEGTLIVGWDPSAILFEDEGIYFDYLP